MWPSVTLNKAREILHPCSVSFLKNLVTFPPTINHKRIYEHWLNVIFNIVINKYFNVAERKMTFIDSNLAWFLQTDARFAIKCITSSETKFYYHVAAIIVFLLISVLTFSRKISRIPVPLLGKLVSARLMSAPKEIRKLLADYPNVFSSDGFTASNPKHDVFHDLPTVPGPPIFAKARRLDPEVSLCQG